MEEKNYDVTLNLKYYNELIGMASRYKNITLMIENIIESATLSYNGKRLVFDDDEVRMLFRTTNKLDYEGRLEVLKENFERVTKEMTKEGENNE